MTSATRGAVLAGRYRLEERVQSSPDGSLWRAVDATLERRVSVRVMRPSHPFAADVADAARRAALVDDPRLVRVLDVGADGDLVYVVSQYVEGDSLASLVERSPLAAPVVRRIIGEVAQGLDGAAARGLHHLRLTPRSVIVVRDGSVKIAGTAVEAAAAGLENGSAATASRVDTVALVALLYSGLTGRWPLGDAGFPAAPRGEGGSPIPPADLVPGVPNDLDSLCTVALGPGDEGPRTPAELVKELAPWPTVAQAPLRAAPRQLPAGAPTGPPGADSPLHLRRRAAGSPLRPARPQRPATGRPPTASPPPAVADPAPDGGGLEPAAPATTREPAPREPTLRDPAAGVGAARGPAAEVPVEAAAGTTAPPDARAPRPEGPARPGRTARPDRPTRGRTVRPARPAGPPSAAGAAGAGVEAGSGRSPDPARPTRPTGPARPGRPGRPARPPRPPRPPRSDRLGPPTGPLLLPRGDLEPPSPLESTGPLRIVIPPEAPPREQSRMVIVIVAALLVVGLAAAAFTLRDLGGDDTAVAIPVETGAPLPTGSGAATAPPPPITPTASPSPTAASPSPSAAPSPSKTPEKKVAVRVAGARAIDPQGDDEENTGDSGRAVDGKSSTTWGSQSYNSSGFGGLKKGIGLVVRLKEKAPVSSVTVRVKGSGGAMELRTSDRDEYDGSKVVGKGGFEDGTLKIDVRDAKPSKYVILWFTDLPSVGGKNKIEVSEVRLK